MIDYIRYIVDGKTYELIDNGDGTWSKQLNAPDVAGNYNLILQISEHGSVTTIDSSDSRYKFYLDVIGTAEKKVNLQNYVCDIIRNVYEFDLIYEIENLEFDDIYTKIKNHQGDMFIKTSSVDKILKLERFLRIKGQGTLLQRKDYLLSLFQKGKKLNETKIKEIANTITGSDCIVKFFGADEIDNPTPGYGMLRVQVLSPDSNKDYRYEDIFRAIKPLVPAHIKLLVVKYFAIFEDIKNNFADWSAVAAMSDWQALKSYIPPQ